MCGLRAYKGHQRTAGNGVGDVRSQHRTWAFLAPVAALRETVIFTLGLSASRITGTRQKPRLVARDAFDGSPDHARRLPDSAAPGWWAVSGRLHSDIDLPYLATSLTATVIGRLATEERHAYRNRAHNVGAAPPAPWMCNGCLGSREALRLGIRRQRPVHAHPWCFRSKFGLPPSLGQCLHCAAFWSGPPDVCRPQKLHSAFLDRPGQSVVPSYPLPLPVNQDRSGSIGSTGNSSSDANQASGAARLPLPA